MLLSKLTKYLHRKSPKTSLSQEKPSEVTCVQSEEIRNDEFEIQNLEDATSSVTDKSVPPSPAGEGLEKPQDTTAHLGGGVPKRVETPRGAMTKAEMREARELFADLSDAEIHRLYKKVTQ